MTHHNHHNHRNLPPNQRISPSSVYYCPMECEGEKLYFKQGRCPVCNMFLIPIEEREDHRNKPRTYSKPTFPRVSETKSETIFVRCFAKVTKLMSQIPVVRFVICIWKKSQKIWSEVRCRMLEVYIRIKTPNT